MEHTRTSETSVRHALARHLHIDPTELDSVHDLEQDLGLDPLDLVLVALRLEEGAASEFPIARLEYVRTVADLAALAQSWAGEESTQSSSTPAATAPRRVSRYAGERPRHLHLRGDGARRRPSR